VTNFVLLFLAGINVSQLGAQALVPVDSASDIRFEIKNFGFTVEGSLQQLQGKIVFDPAALQLSYFNVTVNASTIETGIGLRNRHLKNEDYFDTESYPTIRLISKRILLTDNKMQWMLTGLLMIKGFQKEITFPFKATPHQNGYLFEGRFQVNRKDFHVGGNSLGLSDFVTVKLKVLALQSGLF
jgi:polyisoprenoid-binding protein YceI